MIPYFPRPPPNSCLTRFIFTYITKLSKYSHAHKLHTIKSVSELSPPHKGGLFHAQKELKNYSNFLQKVLAFSIELYYNTNIR